MARALQAVRFEAGAQWLFFGALAIGIGILVPTAPGDGWLLAMSVLILTVSTLLVLRRETDKVSPIALSAIACFLSFAIGAVYYWYSPEWGSFALRRRPWTQHGLAVATAYGTAGWLAMVAGYYLWPKRAFGEGLRMRSLSDGTIVIIFSIGWLAKLGLVVNGSYYSKLADPSASGLTAQSSSSFLILTASTLSLFAIAYLGLTSRTKLFWLGMACELLYAVPRGSRAELVMQGVAMIVVLYYRRGQVPVRAVIVGTVVGVFILFPTLFNYRSSTTKTEAGISRVIKNAVDPPSNAGFVKTGIAATAGRFSNSTTGAAVFTAGRGIYPFSAGQSYSWAATNLVPRRLWPDKVATGHFGGDIARTYELIAPKNTGTGVVLPLSIEGYLNFGLVGGIAVMVIVGLLFGAFNSLLVGRSSPTVAAIYAVLAVQIIASHDTILAQQFTGMLKTCALLIAVAALLTASRLGASPRIHLRG